jgi:hypothetical protein
MARFTRVRLRPSLKYDGLAEKGVHQLVRQESGRLAATNEYQIKD